MTALKHRQAVEEVKVFEDSTYGASPRVATADGNDRIPSEIVSAIMTSVRIWSQLTVSSGWFQQKEHTHATLPAAISPVPPVFGGLSSRQTLTTSAVSDI